MTKKQIFIFKTIILSLVLCIWLAILVISTIDIVKNDTAEYYDTKIVISILFFILYAATAVEFIKDTIYEYKQLKDDNEDFLE